MFPGIIVLRAAFNNVNSFLIVVYELDPSYCLTTTPILFPHPVEISKGLVAPLGPTVPILQVVLLLC